MAWDDVWVGKANTLLEGDIPDPLPPPPWDEDTENHYAGLSAVRYWTAVRDGDPGPEGEDLRKFLIRQREEGLFLREALSPTYDVAWCASLVIAWRAAEERLQEAPDDLVAQEIRALALAPLRFALGLAQELRVADGTVFAPAQRAKALETDYWWERGLTLLAHWYSPVARPHKSLLQHVTSEWLNLQGREAHLLLWQLLMGDLRLRDAIRQAGGPTLQGRLSHPLYWRRDGGELDVWAPWLYARSEGGGKHGKSGLWAVHGWVARSRSDAGPEGRVKGGAVPKGGKSDHPTRRIPPEATRSQWSHVGPDSDPFPLAPAPEAPPQPPDPPPVEEPDDPVPEIDPASLGPRDWNALEGPDKRAALQAIFAVAEHDGPDRIVRVRDRLALAIAAHRAKVG